MSSYVHDLGCRIMKSQLLQPKKPVNVDSLICEAVESLAKEGRIINPQKNKPYNTMMCGNHAITTLIRLNYLDRPSPHRVVSNGREFIEDDYYQEIREFDRKRRRNKDTNSNGDIDDDDDINGDVDVEDEDEDVEYTLDSGLTDISAVAVSAIHDALSDPLVNAVIRTAVEQRLLSALAKQGVSNQTRKQ